MTEKFETIRLSAIHEIICLLGNSGIWILFSTILSDWDCRNSAQWKYLQNTEIYCAFGGSD